MTLIEIVLAIAVAGFVLYASTAYVVSISNIWADREERHFFEDHVDGVTEFLKAAFLHAGYELALGENGETGAEGNNPEEPEQNNPKPKSPQLEKPEIKTQKESNQQEASDDRSGGRSLISKSESPIAWKKPPGAAGYEDPMLHFSLAEIPPLLVGLDDVPATKVELFLHFDEKEGLGLLWHSNLQEEIEDTEDLQRTQLSGLVTGLLYLYWDETFEKWEEEEKPREGEGNEDFLLPRFLKLVFTHNEVTKTRLLPLPVPMDSALLF